MTPTAPAPTTATDFTPDAAAHTRVTDAVVTLRLGQLARIAPLCGRLLPDDAPALIGLLGQLPALDTAGRALLARDPFFHASFTRLVATLRADDPAAAREALRRLLLALLPAAAPLVTRPLTFTTGPGGTLSLSARGPRLPLAPRVPVRFHGTPDATLRWSTPHDGATGATPRPDGTGVVLDGDDERLAPMLEELAADPDSFSTETVRPVPATPLLRSRLDGVLDRLRTAWPAMHDEITANVSLAVPVASRRTAAFSNTAWLGAVFLRADFDDPLFLTERLVHESSHLRLNAVMATEELHRHGWDERVESPFRNGPRPVAGLLHGVFVFTRAAEALLRVGAGTPEADRAARQARALADKVATAMDTLEHSVRLTDAGRHLVDSTGRAHDDVMARCGDVRPADETDYLRGEM